ncbi:MAG: pectate lyase [Planctomycetaceae bacterium]
MTSLFLDLRLGALFLAATVIVFPLAAAEPLAFPGAEGAGAHTPGGRRGKVISVTTLADSGPGSLHAAIDEKGPRTILFRVGGLIELQKPLTVSEPFCTIAGQTAPGDGICLKNFGLRIHANDVVVRHLRVRPGDVMKRELDAISIGSVRRVIVDHCSASWGTDETLSVFGDADDVTVQWCLIAESLNKSVHKKGPHGYGSLVAVDDGDVTFHHNAYVSHNIRNPRPGTRTAEGSGLRFEFANNAICNWGVRAGYDGDTALFMNHVGNYLRPGPSTRKSTRCFFFNVGGKKSRIFAEKNEIDGCPEVTAQNWIGVHGSIPQEEILKVVRSDVPLVKSLVKIEPAADAFRKIVSAAGATRPRRDSVDRRLANEMELGQGKIIDSQAEVGGWPEYETGIAPADSDGDGIPDDWEQTHQLDPSNARDGNADSDGDGYTNLEEWLNDTSPAQID